MTLALPPHEPIWEPIPAALITSHSKIDPDTGEQGSHEMHLHVDAWREVSCQ